MSRNHDYAGEVVGHIGQGSRRLGVEGFLEGLRAEWKTLGENSETKVQK